MSSIGWSKLFKGIRFRLTFVYSTLFGLVLFAFAYIISTQYFQSGRDDFDSRLMNFAIDLSDHLYEDSEYHIVFKVPHSEEKKAFPFILSQTYYSVRTVQGKILATSHKTFPFPEIPYDPTLPLKNDYTHRFLTFSYGEDIYRGVNLKITDGAHREIILQVATNYSSVLSREKNLSILTFLVVPILILFSSFFSFLIAGKALIPIKTLTETANNIAASNLSLRVPEVNTEDEVAELAKTLNNLLERLEKSFEAQENFVANASHQLNTPLAIIKGELDVLESKPRTPEEQAKFFVSLREELERLIDLVKKMLMVSRVESGMANFVMTPIRLDDLLLTTTSRLQSKAKEKRINIRFDIDEEIDPAHLEVKGERQLLDTLFENLLDNAIKYAPEDSSVLLRIDTSQDNKIEVRFKDEGPGIDQTDFKTLMNTRFRRIGGFGIPGTGIGLPIAKKIAELHGAEIIYKKRDPQGSIFCVRFNDA